MRHGEQVAGVWKATYGIPCHSSRPLLEGIKGSVQQDGTEILFQRDIHRGAPQGLSCLGVIRRTCGLCQTDSGFFGIGFSSTYPSKGIRCEIFVSYLGAKQPPAVNNKLLIVGSITLHTTMCKLALQLAWSVISSSEYPSLLV